MKDRSELVEWIRSEIVGPSRPAEHSVAGFSDKVFHDPVALRRGALAWLPDPGSEPQEILFFDRESPHRKYGAGLLFPLEAPSIDEATDAGESADRVGAEADDEELLANAARAADDDGQAGGDLDDDFDVTGPDIRRPSSMGISLCVRLEQDGALVVRLPQSVRPSWQPADAKPFQVNGRYERCVRRWTHDSGRSRDEPAWRRQAAVLPGTSVLIKFADLQHGKVIRRNPALPPSSPLALEVEVFPRRMAEEGAWLITVVLRNKSVCNNRDEERERILYQTYFEAGLEGGTFLPYPESQRSFRSRDADEQSLTLLYRDSPTWAIGHGCAGGWDGIAGQTPAVLYADVMPAAELPSMTPDIETADGPVRLSMRELSALTDTGTGPAWDSLVAVRDAYAGWIAERRSDAQRLGHDLAAVATRHLDLCGECLERIDDGLDLLRTSQRDRDAFRLANVAMLLQQIATKHLRHRDVSWDTAGRRLRPDAPMVSPLEILDRREEDRSRIGSWRAFQIAFLLMSMRGLSEPRSAQREIVDLIWFPTGGGKTEAYLAAMSYHMFRERLLMGTEDCSMARDGTNVLMRYTLRMLTTQQFQRAASLICAMERMRREPGRWGIRAIPGRRFSLGLWIGGDGSPNKNSEARSAITAFRTGKVSGNPLVLTECPWCRCAIGRVRGRAGEHHLAGMIDDRDAGPRLLCPDSRCDFGVEDSARWLPVEVIDERIYANPPSLVIATADKLAMVSYRPDARALFGLDERAGVVARVASPPGLIIQDELHLISGPLGTMYALYEGIFERLCSYGIDGTTVRPKVIASTATIRGAADQVLALYGRKETRLFPSPGLSMGDSFFGRYATDPSGALRSGRMYVGLHAPGYGSVLTTQVRAFSSALYCAARMPADRRDPWWTLLAFYNSIRELGGARTLFDSDIRSRLKYLFNREGVAPADRRNLRVVEELTSRLSQAEIVEMMDRLAMPYGRQEVVDASLASNIIEVGVDIDRLSLMGIVGQPKTTSTYIQVSGRVGRRWQDRPGLILTIYNPGKSRDRSHFEQFHSYHRRLYERVEPTSTTPFAISALRRGVHGALLAWARSNAVFSPEPRLDRHLPALQEALDALEARCLLIQNPADAARSVAEMRRLFDELVSKWRHNPQVWERFPQAPDGEYLMLWPGQFRTGKQRLRGVDVPTSMRQVDASAELSVSEGYTTDDRCAPATGAGREQQQ